MTAPKSLIDTWPLAVKKNGWSSFPTVILRKQRALKLAPLDINILLHLWSYWRLGSQVHPAKGTVAEDIGIAPRTVQRRIEAMEKRGLIRRIERRLPNGDNDSNIYDLEPILAAAEPLALAELARRAQAKRPPRRREFKPSLVVTGGRAHD